MAETDNTKKNLYERIKEKLLNNIVVVIIIIIFIILSSGIGLWSQITQFISKWSSDPQLTSSPYVEYGGVEIESNGESDDTTHVWCEYKGRFKDIDFKFSVTDGINEEFSRVDCIFEEAPKFDCKFQTIQNNKHLYLSDKIYITDETKNIKRVSISYRGDKSNQPRCSLKFEGTIENNKLKGDLIWQRIDQLKHPKLSFNIKYKTVKQI